MALRKTDANGSKSYYPLVIAGDFNLLPGSTIYQFLERGMLDWSCLDYKSMSGYFREANHPVFMGEERIHIRTVSSSTEFVDEEPAATGGSIQPERSDYNEHSRTNQHRAAEGRQLKRPHHQLPNQQVVRSNRGDDNAKVLTHNLKLKSVFNWTDSKNQPLVTTKHDRACEMVDYVFFGQTKELDLVGFRKLLSDERVFRHVPYMPNELIGSDHFSLVTKFSLHSQKKS